MSNLIDFYKQQIPKPSTTIPWLATLQKNAFNDFQQYGFPTRHDEEWKYTRVEALLEQRFIKATLPDKIPHQDRPATLLNCPLNCHITIYNGQECIDETRSLPLGVIVQPLAQALEEHADKIKLHFGKLLHHQHGFQAFNTAAWQAGVFIYIPEGLCLPDPIVIAHWQDRANQAVYVRCLIIAEAQSQATIVNYFEGANDCSYLTNSVTEAYIAENANIDHYAVQCESRAAFHTDHLAVKQLNRSHFNSHSLSLGGKLVRSDSTFYLQEEKAQCLLNGIYMPANNQHIDHHTTINHLCANCTSIQDYKGVLIGQAQALFNGKVVVAKEAQKTCAQQQNKNLLLSSNAQINTKPQLEIFADDVTCSHGATVGQLDEDALFYLTTRGIDKADGCRYLIQAFAADNLHLISNRMLADWMADLINQQWG
jgi:Fe-S cluster assembly protein SufD